MSLTLSVVIPTYQRADLLRRGLEGLAAQTLARERFEVLVVDDGSPAPPDAVVADFASRLPVRLLKKPNGGLASARNHGAAQATGDVLVFMDDDIAPCPSFLEEHLKVHEADERAIAFGSLPHPEELPVTPFLYYLNRILHYDLPRRYGSVERVPLPPLNGNSSVRRRWFEDAGGYDRSFAAYGGEDTEMGYRLVKRGLTFVYAPRARGAHWHVKGYDAYRRDMRSSGAAIVAIVRKYPEVLARVNLDIVTARLRDLPAGKKVQRLVLRTLDRAPVLVRAMEGLIARLEPLDLKRVLYPLYLVAAHYHYAAGMRDEIARAGLPPGGSASTGVGAGERSARARG